MGNENRKNTNGIIRKIDSLGRIVIPKEMRKVLGINIGEPLEILQINKEVLIRKRSESCELCGDKEGLLTYKGIRLCRECRRKIGAMDSLEIETDVCEDSDVHI